MPSFRLQRATALVLQGVALLLLGLHLYVRFALPPSPPNTVPEAQSAETAWWGLWPVQYLAPWQVLVGVAAVIGAIGAVWLLRPRQGEDDTAAPAGPLSGWRPYLLPAATALLFAAFYLFPLAHTRWGDAYVLAKGIAWSDPALRLTHSWQAPLDVFLHGQVWAALHEPLGWEDAAPAYRLLSPLAGLLYLLLALALSRDLSRPPWCTPPWLTYGLLATLGLVQLFFGYIENYSFAAAGVLGYLWLGLGVLRGERPLWPAAALLALTNATHPSTVILAPSLLYLGWRVWQGTGMQTGTRSGDRKLAATAKLSPPNLVPLRNQSWLAVVGEIALPMLLIGGATFVWMEASGHGLYALFNTDRPGGSDARWFVPLWATSTRWEHYTLFSWAHLRDWLNGQLLVAPVVLPALVIVLVSLWLARREALPHGRGSDGAGSVSDLSSLPHGRGSDGAGSVSDPSVYGTRFLLLAAGFYLLFTSVWNADYGGQRDWDLFSLAALPLTLLLAVLLPRALPDRWLLRAGAVPLLVLGGWHTWAWIVQNTLPWKWPD